MKEISKNCTYQASIGTVNPCQAICRNNPISQEAHYYCTTTCFNGPMNGLRYSQYNAALR